MKLLYVLTDNQFEDNGWDNERLIVRGICYNDKKEVALIHLLCDDFFGHRDYYETPGGGVEENEALEEALKRELTEELGADIDNIEEIGRVVDFYNKINRKNNQHYYLCHLTKLSEKHLTRYEKIIMENVVWVDIDTAIKLYKESKDTPISILVKKKEIPILKIAKEMLSKKD